MMHKFVFCRITPYSYPTEDEFMHHEIANNFDSYDGNSDVAYESEFEQLTEYIPNDVFVNEGEDVVYDGTPTDPDALMNDIFGVDSDDEVDNPTTENSKSEEILDKQPRRSARNHQPGRWNKRLVGLSIPSYKDSVMCKYRSDRILHNRRTIILLLDHKCKPDAFIILFSKL